MNHTEVKTAIIWMATGKYQLDKVYSQIHFDVFGVYAFDDFPKMGSEIEREINARFGDCEPRLEGLEYPEGYVHEGAEVAFIDYYNVFGEECNENVYVAWN